MFVDMFAFVVSLVVTVCSVISAAVIAAATDATAFVFGLCLICVAFLPVVFVCVVVDA